MTLTRRLQFFSALGFFVSLWLLAGAVVASGIGAAAAPPFTACLITMACVFGLEARARREDDIARMNRAPLPSRGRRSAS